MKNQVIKLPSYKDIDQIQSYMIENYTLDKPQFILEVSKIEKHKFLVDIEKSFSVSNKIDLELFNKYMEAEKLEFIGPMGFKVTVINKIKNEQESSIES